MQLMHHDFVFEINDDWWAEAGMANFVPTSRSYSVDRQAFPGHQPYEVKIRDIEPVRRQLGHGVFNDQVETGETAKSRFSRILAGFLRNDDIPPVELVLQPQGARHKYKLTHGAHRFYLSIAAGFTHIPAVDGFDPNDSGALAG